MLLIDDDRAVRRLATRIIAGAGLDVISAGDGIDAMEKLEQHGADICCVVLDLTMPRMGGEETFRELRRLRPDLPVILSSGYEEGDVVERFPRRELSGFVKKPYVADDLIAKLRAALGR